MLLMFLFEVKHLKNALLPDTTVSFVRFTSVLCLEFTSLSYKIPPEGGYLRESGQGRTGSTYFELKTKNGETPVMLREK